MGAGFTETGGGCKTGWREEEEHGGGEKQNKAKLLIFEIRVAEIIP